jgi:CDP-diacylglycerol--glycerol-3-phosphate 3-phosphatidyltransferase/cardiolipin synthase
MGHYRIRHLLMVPSLVSLARLPLAALFATAVDEPPLALATLVAAGLSDVIDGWYARKFDQVTATGAVVDGITDKLFMLVVVLSLVTNNALGVGGALLLGTREIGEAPLVAWWAVHRPKRKARANDPRANAFGKLCTTLQFAAILACLLGASWLDGLLVLTGASGVLAAIHYWRRELARSGS